MQRIRWFLFVSLLLLGVLIMMWEDLPFSHRSFPGLDDFSRYLAALGLILLGILAWFIPDRDDSLDHLKSRSAHVANVESMIDFQCPACGKQYHGPASLQSSTFHCRHCGNSFAVQATEKNS